MIPSPNFTQTALEALNLLQKAENKHLPAEVSKKGSIKILHTSQISAQQSAAATLTIVEAVMNKLQNEAAANVVVTGRNILGLLSQRLPSLNHFVMTGRVGKLREEWQKYRQELDRPTLAAQAAIESQQKAHQQRLQHIADAYDYLPKGLEIVTKLNAISELNYPYSTEDQKILIGACKILQADEVDPVTGLTSQTMSDINRHEYTFKIESKLTPSAEKHQSDSEIAVTIAAALKNNQAAEKINAVKRMMGNSLASETLLKFTNQVIFSALEKIKNKSLGTLSGKIPMFNRSPEIQRFTMLCKLNGDIEINIMRIKKSKIMASEDGSKQWKIGSGKPVENPASENDYTEKYSATVLAKKVDLEKWIINFEYINGSYSMCIYINSE